MSAVRELSESMVSGLNTRPLCVLLQVEAPQAPPLVLTSGSEETMGVTWGPTRDKLAVASADYRVRLWRVERNRGRTADVVGTCVEDTRGE